MEALEQFGVFEGIEADGTGQLVLQLLQGLLGNRLRGHPLDKNERFAVIHPLFQQVTSLISTLEPHIAIHATIHKIIFYGLTSFLGGTGLKDDDAEYCDTVYVTPIIISAQPHDPLLMKLSVIEFLFRYNRRIIVAIGKTTPTEKSYHNYYFVCMRQHGNPVHAGHETSAR